MKNTLLFQVWESLSSVEIRRLEKFLNSPYHNRHEGVLKLYDFLKKFGHEPDEALTRERVFAFIFGDIPYDDLKLRHVMSYLLKAQESFLMLESEDIQTEGDFLLLETYLSRKLESPFQTKWNSLQKQATAGGQHGDKYHQSMLRLKDAAVRAGIQAETGEMLSDLSEELDAWYLIRKLRAATGMLRYKKRYRKSLSNGLLDPIVITAKIMGLLKPTEIAIHFHTYQCLNEPDDLDHFANLKDTLPDADGVIGLDEMREVLEIAIEYCAEKVDNGRDQFKYEAFKFYARGVENGAWMENGQYTPERLSQIMQIAVDVDEPAWASEFLENIQEKIAGPAARSHYLMNKSQRLLAEKKYDEVKALLENVFIKNVPARLEAETYLMQALYELGEKETLDKLIGSFLRGLHRKETPSDKKKSYRSFGKTLRRILKNPDDKEKLSEIQGDLAISNDALCRDWLLGVIETLI